MVSKPLHLAVVLIGCTVAGSLRAAHPMLNAYARPGLDLDGKWHTIIDPYDTGYYDYRRQPLDASPNPKSGYFLDQSPSSKSDLVEYNFDESPTLDVPGDWNSQDDKLFYYEGTIWYRRRFDYVPSSAGRRLFLYFGAANYQSDIYLNGKKLGQHVGGFTPFQFEVTGLVKAKGNSLVVRVNNQRHLEAVPTLNTDWWNYGGLTRDVRLIDAPATFISDYRVQLRKGRDDLIDVSVQVDGSSHGRHVVVTIPEAKLSAAGDTDDSGMAHFELPAPHLQLWSPEKPRLYTVEVTTATDRVSDRVGFRTIEVRGTDILLNGHPIFLRGVCLHEENPLRGARAYSEEDARLLLSWAKELNCNFIRLAHYPHNEHMARVADEMGIMLWEEVPVYWTIQWENPDTLANAQAQLTDLIIRDRDRASVIVWSVANETPVSSPRTRFLKALVDTARRLDDTRLVSAAMEVRIDPADPNGRIVDDPFGAYTDLLSFNEYVGWYMGLPDNISHIKWSLGYDKPVVISEFGGDALQGYHGDKLTRFSEEYQGDLYRKTLAMLQQIPQWRGATPWILCDFRSPRRPLPKMQDGWNRKGLIGSNGKKKAAYFVLKDFYDDKAAAVK